VGYKISKCDRIVAMAASYIQHTSITFII